MYQKPTIFNLTLTLAGTEYPQAIPLNARKFVLRERSGGSDLQLAFALGESGTNFVTIPAGSSKALDGVYLSGLSLFLQSPDAGKIVEIEVWSDK